MDGRLERLERDLSDPNKSFTPKQRPSLQSTARLDTTPHDWKRIPDPEPVPARKEKTFLDKLFIGSIAFFIIAALGAALAWMFDWGAVSRDKIAIEVTGETNVSAGSPASFEVLIENRNNDPIQNAKLIISYPTGMRDKAGKDLVRETKGIGFIDGSQKTRERFEFIPFGQVDEEKEILIRLEYTVPGSTAAFSLEESFSAKITSSPMTFSANFPGSISPGQEFSFTLSFSSSAKESFENLILNAEYPEGYEFKSASILPDRGNNSWIFTSVDPREKQTLSITGVFNGNTSSLEKTFRFEMGTGARPRDTTIVLPILLETKTVSIADSPIAISISIPTSRVEGGVLQGSSPLPVSLYWSNNSTSQIRDAEVILELEGSVWDTRNVETKGVVNGTVIRWSESESRDLGNIAVGEEGNVGAKVPIDLDRASGDVSLLATFRGSLNGGSQSVLATKALVLKLGQSVELVAEAQRSGATQGPYPPQVGVATSYALSLSLVSERTLEGSKVTFILPENVTIFDAIRPTQGSFTFNQATREGTWSAGRIPSGSGSVTPAPRLLVPVLITPASADVGTLPDLARTISLYAQSESGDLELVSRIPRVTTQASDDEQRGIVRNP